MEFECVNQTKKGKETWTGRITSIINYGSHYEIAIDSRSGIMVLIGKTSMGTFACMPDFSAGCHLATLDDMFYSTEKLTDVMGRIDGITVASALYSIADKIHFK